MHLGGAAGRRARRHRSVGAARRAARGAGPVGMQGPRRPRGTGGVRGGRALRTPMPVGAHPRARESTRPGPVRPPCGPFAARAAERSGLAGARRCTGGAPGAPGARRAAYRPFRVSLRAAVQSTLLLYPGPSSRPRPRGGRRGAGSGHRQRAHCGGLRGAAGSAHHGGARDGGRGGPRVPAQLRTPSRPPRAAARSRRPARPAVHTSVYLEYLYRRKPHVHRQIPRPRAQPKTRPRPVRRPPAASQSAGRRVLATIDLHAPALTRCSAGGRECTLAPRPPAPNGRVPVAGGGGWLRSGRPSAAAGGRG
jgi:hypothetical protein